MKYAKQVNKNDCSLVLIYNILKWSGSKTTNYQAFLKKHKNLYDPSIGMEINKLEKLIRSGNKNFKFVKKRVYEMDRLVPKGSKIPIEFVEDEIQKGRSIVYLFFQEKVVGHVVLLINNGKHYSLINYLPGHSNATINRRNLKKLFNISHLNIFFVLEKK